MTETATGSIGQLGILGGSGMLGQAIIAGLLRSGRMAAGDIIVANQSGTLAPELRSAGVQIETDRDLFWQRCTRVLFCVPPAAAAEAARPAANSLILSVMAGVSVARLMELTGSSRVIRAMSSPAAARGLAYSPWVNAPGAEPQDRAFAAQLFGALGSGDALAEERHLDVFTAITGPVPGFVAFFADAMARFAETRGIERDIADRAVRQLFLAAGQEMAQGLPRPQDHMREMIEYGGTTAAGLLQMQQCGLAEGIAKALFAAERRCAEIAG